MWCVAELDEEYIRRMEDVLKLYEKPLSEEEPVVCIDEKPVVLHADIRPPLPPRPGHLARRDYEYPPRRTAVRPMSFAAWNRKPDGISQKPRRRVARPSLPTIWWRSSPNIPGREPSIWFWTT